MTGELQWQQVSFLRRNLELMQDGAVIARARVVPQSGLIVDETRRTVLGQTHEVLFFKREVMLADGTKYVWLPNFISTQHAWVTGESREPVMAFGSRHFMIRSKGTIGILHDLDKQHERCLLALGWWWVAGIR